MRKLAVGELFVEGRTEWPECNQYNYTTSGHQLTLFYDKPTEKEIADVRKGEAKFQLLAKPEALCFLYKIGDQPWCDAYFNYWVNPEHFRQDPEKLMPGQLPTIMIYLVDASTGIIQAIRMLTFSEAFGQRLHKAIEIQIASPSTKAEYERAVNQWMQYDTRQLVDLAMRTK